MSIRMLLLLFKEKESGAKRHRGELAVPRLCFFILQEVRRIFCKTGHRILYKRMGSEVVEKICSKETVCLDRNPSYYSFAAVLHAQIYAGLAF